MKFNTIEFPIGKNTPLSTSKHVILPILTLVLLTIVPLYIYDTSPYLLRSLEIITNGSIPLCQKNNLSSPLQSPAVTTNISTSLLQSLEIDTNGSTLLKSNPFSPVESLTTNSNGSTSPQLSPDINGNGSTTQHQKNNLSSPRLSSATTTNDSTIQLRSLQINTDGSTPLYQRNSSSLPSQSITANDSTSLKQSLEINTNGSSTLLYQKTYSSSSLHDSSRIATNGSTRARLNRGCNIFKGNWVPHPKGPYYTNETKCVIDDRQNCMKFGRPDTEFLKWRWKPYKCELPLFDAVQFLELVRGKTLAFLGDSVGRNQMQSLVCLLASVANPLDVSYTRDTRFRRWLYTRYNFTIAALWSPLLVKADEADSHSNLMNLYLDEADEAWAAHIENVDILIVSAGQWFFRPFLYYEKGKVVGCHNCDRKNIGDPTPYYGYKMAFRTVFRTLLSLQKFKGLTFLRTFSPAHFEDGEWSKGGHCARTRPFTEQEMKLDGYNLEFYKTQVQELRAAERRGRKRGLKFKLLDTTEAMVMRPDGHPNHYGHWPHENTTLADCVHWCMPGPVDTWNEFLLQVLKMEREG